MALHEHTTATATIGRRKGVKLTDQGRRFNLRKTADALMGKGPVVRQGRPSTVHANAFGDNLPIFSRGQARHG